MPEKKTVNGQNTLTTAVFVDELPAWSVAVTTIVFGPRTELRFIPFVAGEPLTVAEQVFRPEPTSEQANWSLVLSWKVTVAPSPGVSAIAGGAASIGTGTLTASGSDVIDSMWIALPEIVTGDVVLSPPFTLISASSGAARVAVTGPTTQPFEPVGPESVHEMPPTGDAGAGGAR